MRKRLKTTKGQAIVFLIKKDGVDCPFFVLKKDEKHVRTLASSVMIQRDFHIAKDAISALISFKDKDHPHSHALLTDAVISYARAFSGGAAKAKDSKLDHTEMFNGKPELLKKHEKILFLRNQLMAHSGVSDYDEVPIYAALDPDMKNKSLHAIYPAAFRAVALETLNYLDMLEVCNFAIGWSNMLVDNASTKLLSILNKKHADVLYKVATFPDKLGADITKVYMD